ncbi:MAG TPA: hypothetical protein VIM73_11640 [Polyangiaceae bacterium]
MKVRATGISAARARLADLVVGLRAATSGEVVERAAAKVQSQIDAVSKRILANHVDTGHAQSEAQTSHSGALIQLTVPTYVGFHEWWPFRSGMPPFVLGNASRIFSAELRAALAGERSPLIVADEVAEEKAAEKSRAKFKRDIARIYRQSDEAKEARKKAAAQRRRERALAKANGS